MRAGRGPHRVCQRTHLLRRFQVLGRLEAPVLYVRQLETLMVAAREWLVEWDGNLYGMYENCEMYELYDMYCMNAMLTVSFDRCDFALQFLC